MPFTDVAGVVTGLFEHFGNLLIAVTETAKNRPAAGIHKPLTGIVIKINTFALNNRWIFLIEKYTDGMAFVCGHG